MTKREILFLKNGKMETVSRPRMTKGVSCNRYIRTFYLCTHTCPYRLAMLGTSLRVRGKLTLRKKEFIFLLFKIRFWRFPMPNSLLWVICIFSSIDIPILSAAQEWRQKWIALRCDYKWFFYKKKKIRNESRPQTREASEPLFEERSDAVKVCETLCLG